MKAILSDMRSGQIGTYEVPQPELQSGGILVRTAYSAISAGTERAKLQQAEKSLVGKALARPDLVRQVVDYARVEGIKAAYQRVQARLDPLSPLGYSCSGVVIAVGEGVGEFQPGDRVACGGGGYANHHEINFVPRNLAVRLPDSVPLDAAALTTIGAIALQGFRQAQVNFGETVAVIGSGLVGVLTILLAKAAGCRVIALDLSPQRIDFAVKMGADLGLSSADKSTQVSIKEFSRYGVDAAIITAATHSTDPIELAAEIARDRGRIVIVGDVGLGVSRSTVYHKELSVVLSRSYGPGRYDPQYEEGGVDYPVGYVRWTEQRNMDAFVQAMASGSLNVKPLIERRYPVAEGDKAYADIRDSGVYTVLIEYPAAPAASSVESVPAPAAARKVRSGGELRVGAIGAGSFAKNVIFPELRKAKNVVLQAVATASGVAAQSAVRSFQFKKAMTSIDLLQDPDTDAIFVLSRHDSHARYVASGLARHKAIYVEKPLAISQEQLEEICYAYQAETENGHNPFVMVGFNRRFAPMTSQLKEFFAKRQEPMVVHARVNAGFIPSEHWTQQKGDGGRIVGELCHFLDWIRWVVGAPIKSISARALPDGSRYNRDNVVVNVSFRDGSIGSLLYLANGDKAVPKEFFEVFSEGGVAILNDWETLDLTRNGKTTHVKGARDKGHAREIELTLEAMRGLTKPPIPFEEIVEVTGACIAIHQAISTGQPIDLQQTVLQQKVESQQKASGVAPGVQ